MLFAGSKSALALSLLAMAAVSFAQDGTLTLDQALELAKQRNGNVRAAYLAKESARSRTRQSLSAFFPTLTPTYEYLTSRIDRQTGPFKGVTEDDGHTSELVARWQLLDSGYRQWNLSASRLNEDAQSYQALQTLRQVLFTVHQQYFNTLRAQELLGVAQEQVNLADNILQQTRALVEQGESAPKDILQAEADYLNAKVQLLVAKNRTTTAEADLKAVIGWQATEPIPKLATYKEPVTTVPAPLDDLMETGVATRADLRAERLRADAERYSVLIARQDATYSYSLDANYRKQFSEDVLDSQSLSFVVSLPLFDAGRTREIARQAKYSYEAAKASLVQSERDAKAEIEAAYAEVVQNSERVDAASAALAAARKNFEAAEGSRTEGASDLITTLTARLSLATAQSNYVEAIFDTYIANARLKLAVGDEIPGEK